MSTHPTDPTAPAPTVVVTGANGLVGARVCAVVAERGAAVRALVRRADTAPVIEGVTEWVGDLADPDIAAAVVEGADAVVTTVHPMGSDLETQRRVGVDGTRAFAVAARDAGVDRLVHVSTAAVYDRSPGGGDVDEESALVGDDAGDYPLTKREAESALDQVDGITRVLVRPPAILGPGETSIWNMLRPERIRRGDESSAAPPDGTFAWVHVDDLAGLVADLATGRIPAADGDRGPAPGGCTPVNVAGEPATQRDYLTVVSLALGVEPEWSDDPAWTGRIRTDRARRWGWEPTVTREQALAEVESGLAP